MSRYAPQREDERELQGRGRGVYRSGGERSEPPGRRARRLSILDSIANAELSEVERLLWEVMR
jgi:hypothetical protein